MTNLELERVYNGLESISKKGLTGLKVSHYQDLFKIKAVLKPQKEVLADTVMALGTKYADAEGKITGEDFIEYNKELNELYKGDIEEVEIVKLSVPESVNLDGVEHLLELCEFVFK